MAYYIELKENLLGNYREFDAMADQVFKNLNNIHKLLKRLRDFSNKKGPFNDSDSLRTNLKENLFETTFKLKETLDILNRMESIKVNPNKTNLKRTELQKLRQTYNKEFTEATKLIEVIEKQEKKHLQSVRVSIQNKERESLHQESHPEKMNQWAQMDLDEEILYERENDIAELTKLLKEMHALASLQRNIIHDHEQEIVMVTSNIENTKRNVVQAEKELKNANHYKHNLVQSDTKCLVIATIDCLVFVVLFLLSSSPDAIDSDLDPIPSKN